MSLPQDSLYSQIFSNYPDVLSIPDLSDMLGISTKTAYKLLRDNKIDHFRIGRTYKIPKINVFKYMAVKV